MKKIILAFAILSCLSACGKKDSTEPTKAQKTEQEQQDYRPPTEWTKISKLEHPTTKEALILYYRAVSTDETIKGIKVETGVQLETDSGKSKIIPKWDYIVNCEKMLAKDGKSVLSPTQNHQLFEFACGIPPDIKIKETNAAAEVQVPSSVNKPVQTAGESFDGIFFTDRHSIRIVNNNGSYTYEAWKQPKQLDDGKPDLEVKGGWIDDAPSTDCDVGRIVFKKGNLKMTVLGVNESNRSCFASVPSGAVGRLQIFINGVQKDQYWLYRS